MTSLATYHAIVCGSTQGIGRACALKLAERGASITLVARNTETLDATRNELPAAPDQTHHALAADFHDWQTVHDQIEAHVNAHGPAHILVNNTGGPPPGPASDAEPQAYLDAFTQHLICNQVLTQAVRDGMRDAGYGRIINIISTSVITPIRGLGVSNTIRGAVANWARTLAVELASENITVNNILPGYTQTDRLNAIIERKAERAGTSIEAVREQMTATVPVDRFAEPEEIAAAVAFLASPDAAYITGVNLPVDGGRLAVG